MAQRPLVVMVLTAALLPLLFLGVAGHNATCRECQEQPRSKLLDTWLIKTIDLEDAFKGLQVQVLVTCESGVSHCAGRTCFDCTWICKHLMGG